MSQQDKRRFSRVSVAVEVLLKVEDFAQESCRVINLSLNGIYLQTSQSYSIGQNCEVTICLSEEEKISTQGYIARREDQGVGIAFQTVLGPESFEHLQKLVLYNSQNPDQVIDEFSQNKGIHKKIVK